MNWTQFALILVITFGAAVFMAGAIAFARWLLPPQDDPELAEARFHDLLCGDDDEDDSHWFDVRTWPLLERIFRPTAAKLTYRGDPPD